MKGRSNEGSALSRKANKALRALGIVATVRSSGYGPNGMVSAEPAALMLAHLVLAEAGIEVSPIVTYHWGSQFYISRSAVSA